MARPFLVVAVDIQKHVKLRIGRRLESQSPTKGRSNISHLSFHIAYSGRLRHGSKPNYITELNRQNIKNHMYIFNSRMTKLFTVTN